MAGTDFSQGELEARCRDFARGLESHDTIAAGEITACFPAPGETDWWVWVQTYTKLRLLHDRAQRPGLGTSTLESDDARVTDALRGAPKRVRLLGHARASEGGATEPTPGAEVYVFPKGYLALLECHAIGARLGWLGERIFVLQQRPSDPADLELLERSLRELTHLQRKLAWIATTPGPGLPYPDFPLEPPAVPDTFDTWDGWDFLALANAFQEVNSLRQTAVDRLLAGVPREDGQGVVNGWSVFFGSVAQELGEDTLRIMRDRPLVSLLATVRVAAGARAAAMDHAKQQNGED